jgi:hypothetical protein
MIAQLTVILCASVCGKSVGLNWFVRIERDGRSRLLKTDVPVESIGDGIKSSGHIAGSTISVVQLFDTKQHSLDLPDGFTSPAL